MSRQRQRRPCAAHTSHGAPCRAWAVTGATVCRSHGGSAPQIRAAADRREVLAVQAAAVQALALPKDIDPAVALREEVHRAAGALRYLDRAVADLPDLFVQTMFGPKPHPLVELWVEERKRLVIAATADLRAGVEERVTTLQEDTAALVAGVLRAVIDDLDLTPAERARVPELLNRHLRAVTSSPDQGA